MTVINIFHDGDYIGTAKDYRTAVQFLVGNEYITDSTEVAPFVVDPSGDAHFEYGKMDEVLGEDWADKMAEKWDIENFNDFWDYWYELREVEVIE